MVSDDSCIVWLEYRVLAWGNPIWCWVWLGPGPQKYCSIGPNRYSWRTQKGEQNQLSHHWQGSSSASGQGSPHMMASRTAGTGRGWVCQCWFCILVVVGDWKNEEIQTTRMQAFIVRSLCFIIVYFVISLLTVPFDFAGTRKTSDSLMTPFSLRSHRRVNLDESRFDWEAFGA